MLRRILQRVLFRRYHFEVHGWHYVVRVGRWRFGWRGALIAKVVAYAQSQISLDKQVLVPPGLKIYFDADEQP